MKLFEFRNSSKVAFGDVELPSKSIWIPEWTGHWYTLNRVDIRTKEVAQVASIPQLHSLRFQLAREHYEVQVRKYS